MRSAPWALLALLWLWWPGASHDNALRLWALCGALPLLWWSPITSISARRWGYPLLACAGLAALWSLWVASPGAALLEATRLMGACAALWWGWRLAQRRAALEALPAVAALGGAGVALTALWRPGGTLGNPNWLAHLLVLTLIWTLSGVGAGPRRGRAALWASALCQLGVILACHSLGAALALVVVGAARLLAPRRRRWAWAPAAALLALGALCLPPVVEHLEGRAWLLAQGWEAVSRQPWGAGPGQVAPALLQAQASLLEQAPLKLSLWTYADHVHNEFLQIWLALGPLGSLLWVPLLGALASRGAGAARLCALATCALGLVSLPLHQPATAALAWLSVGVALGSASTLEADRAHGEPGWLPTWAWRAACVAALLLSTSHLLADRLLVRGVEEQHPETLTLAAALSLEPGRAQRHQGWLLVEAGRPREALPLVQSALGRSPDPTAWVLLGRTWMALGELERAREAFAQAVWLHPGLFAGHFNLARACEDLGRRHEARRHAQRARSLHPGDPRLRWLPQ